MTNSAVREIFSRDIDRQRDRESTRSRTEEALAKRNAQTRATQDAKRQAAAKAALDHQKKLRNAEFEAVALDLDRPFYRDEFDNYQWEQDDETFFTTRRQTRLNDKKAEIETQKAAQAKAREDQLALVKSRAETLRDRIDVLGDDDFQKLQDSAADARKGVGITHAQALSARAEENEDEALRERLATMQLNDDDFEYIREVAPDALKEYDGLQSQITEQEKNQKKYQIADQRYRETEDALFNFKAGQISGSRPALATDAQEANSVGGLIEQAMHSRDLDQTRAAIQEKAQVLESSLEAAGASRDEAIAQSAQALNDRLARGGTDEQIMLWQGQHELERNRAQAQFLRTAAEIEEESVAFEIERESFEQQFEPPSSNGVSTPQVESEIAAIDSDSAEQGGVSEDDAPSLKWAEGRAISEGATHGVDSDLVDSEGNVLARESRIVSETGSRRYLRAYGSDRIDEVRGAAEEEGLEIYLEDSPDPVAEETVAATVAQVKKHTGSIAKRFENEAHRVFDRVKDGSLSEEDGNQKLEATRKTLEKINGETQGILADAVADFGEGRLSLRQFESIAGAVGMDGVTVWKQAEEASQARNAAYDEVRELYTEARRIEKVDGVAVAKKVFVESHPIAMVKNAVSKLRREPGSAPNWSAELAEKTERFQATLDEVRAEKKQKEAEVFSKYNFSDEEADLISLQASLDGFKSRDVGAAEVWTNVVNNPEQYAPFVDDLAKLEDLAPVIHAANKAREGEELNDTDTQYLQMFADQASRDSNLAGMVSGTLVHLLALGAEMYLTGGLYTAGKKATKKAITESIEWAASKEAAQYLAKKTVRGLHRAKIGKGGLRWTKKLAEDSLATTVGATLQTPLNKIDFITAETIKDMYLPDMETYAGQDLAEWASAPGAGFGEAIQRAGYDAWAEVLSERSGGLFTRLNPFKGFSKGLQERVMRLSFARAVSKTVGGKLNDSQLAGFMRRLGYNGPVGEMLEERFGSGVRDVGYRLTDGAVGEEFQLPTLKQVAAELIAFTVPGAAATVANEARAAQTSKQYRAQFDGIDTGFSLDDPQTVNAAIRELDPEAKVLNEDDLSAASNFLGDVGGDSAFISDLQTQFDKASRNRYTDAIRTIGQTLVQARTAQRQNRIARVAAAGSIARDLKATKATIQSAIEAADQIGDDAALAQAQGDYNSLHQTSAALKVASGRALDALTSAETASLAVPDPITGVPVIDTSNAESPIVTDALRDRILAQYPDAETLISLDETGARAQASSKKQADTPTDADAGSSRGRQDVEISPEDSGTPFDETSRPVSTPEPSGQWTAKSFDGINVSIPAGAARTETEASRLLAEQLPANSDMLDPDSVTAPTAPTSSTNPGVPDAAQVDSSTSTNESELAPVRTPLEEVSQNALNTTVTANRRPKARGFVKIIERELQRFGEPFGNVAFETASQGSGLQFVERGGVGTLVIDLNRLVDQLSGVDGAAYIRAGIAEELIHMAAVDATDPQEIVDLWESLPEEIRDPVRRTYFNALENAEQALPQDDPWQLGHEFLRMVVQDKAFAGQISESVEIAPGTKKTIADFLQRIAETLRSLIESAPASTQARLGELESRVLERLADMGVEVSASKPKPKAKRKRAKKEATGKVDLDLSTPAEAAPTTDEPVNAGIIARGDVHTAYTSSGNAIEVQYAVVDERDLITSNMDDGRTNPDYDQRLQGRDRDTAASQSTVQDIATKTNLDRLSNSSDTGSGAPIVGEDLQVESGNARSMGIRRAYRLDNPNVYEYRKAIIDRAAEFGLDPSDLAAVSRPVLIRVRRSAVDRVEFANDANRPAVSQMSEREIAQRDAKSLTPEILQQISVTEDGDVYGSKNNAFFNEFFRSAVSLGEAGSLVDERGILTAAGLRRVRNALVLSAFGDNDTGLRLFEQLAENPDPDLANLNRALLSATPEVARIRSTHADYDIGPDLANAARTMIQIRRESSSVDDFLNQGQLLGDPITPFEKTLLQWLDGNLRTPAQMAGTLNNYAVAVDNAQQQDFTSEEADRETLWSLAASREDVNQNELFSAERTRYETDEYAYLGEAPADWRRSDDAEASIVSPIDPDATPDEKVDQLNALSRENEPKIAAILADLAKIGLEGKSSIKLPERIQAKASRPSIRDEKPWHDVEHVRDGLRFKVTLTDFKKLPQIAAVLKKNGVETIKFDTAKMFAPKSWGWRFVAFDLRMPNGQLVEFYAPLPELDNKAVKGPNHVLFEKWRNASDSELNEQRDEWTRDIVTSSRTYGAAFDAALKRMGYSSESEAFADWNILVARASSLTVENTSRISYASGVPSRQDSPSFLRNPSGNTANSPRSDSNTKTSALTNKDTPEPSKTKVQFSGSLGISRDQMPQIPNAVRERLTDELQALEIGTAEETIDPADLTPAQSHYSPERVINARKRLVSEPRRTIISRDNYVLDGHHQYVAAIEDGQDLPVLRIDADVQDGLAALHSFEKRLSSASRVTKPKREKIATALKAYKILRKKAEKGPLTSGQQQTLVNAEKILGQAFMFEDGLFAMSPNGEAAEDHAPSAPLGAAERPSPNESDTPTRLQRENRTRPGETVLARNGRPSTLFGNLLKETGDRSSAIRLYEQAHGEDFKSRFGDWEALAVHQSLEKEPVVSTQGTEFTNEGKGLISAVLDHWENRGTTTVNHPLLGDITFNKAGIRDSWNHGKTKRKASLFFRLPEMAEQSTLIGTRQGKKGEVDRLILAAPVSIGGTKSIAIAVLIRDINTQRLYLHDVWEKEELQTSPNVGGLNQRTGTPPATLRKIVEKFVNFNPDSVTVETDTNGEPQVTASQIEPRPQSATDDSIFNAAARIPASPQAEVISKLPTKPRAIIEGRLADQSFEDIAAEQGITPQKAESIYNGATKAIRSKANREINTALTTAAKDVDRAPTEAQKEAGNYQMGHAKLHGLDLTLENPRGSIRRGQNAAGKKWATKMAHHYGYFRKTEGADGDHIDVFVGPEPASQAVYVVYQVDPETGQFDEHKVMLGFTSQSEAEAGYLANYQKGWKGMGPVTPMTIEDFREWSKDPDIPKVDDSAEAEAEEMSTIREAFAELDKDLPDEAALRDLYERSLESGPRASYEELREKGLSETTGQRTVGVPEKANYAEDGKIRREIDVVQMARRQDMDRQTHEMWNNQARELLKTDRDGVMNNLLTLAREGQPIGDAVQVKAAQLLIPSMFAEAIASRDPQSLRDAQVLAYSYDAAGTEQARAFTARRDPFKSRKERHAEFLAKLISKPDRVTQKVMENAPSPAEKARKIAQLQKALAEAEADNSADIAQLQSELDYTRSEADRFSIMADAQAKRLAKIEKTLADMGVSLSEIFNHEAVVRLRGSVIVKRVLEQFSEKQRLAIRDMIDGHSDRQISKKLGVPRKALPILEDKFDAKMLEVFTDLARRGHTLADFELQDSAGNRFDLANQMDDAGNLLSVADRSGGPADKSAEESAVEEMMSALKPGRRVRNTGRVKRITSEKADSPHRFDPDSATHAATVARAIQTVDGNGFDMLTEYWINGILSGPQTQVVNIQGNALNIAFEYGVQRWVEAGLNTLVRDPGAAQLGELSWAAKGVSQGWTRAFAKAKVAWNTEVSMFEAEKLNDPSQIHEMKSSKAYEGNPRAAIPGRKGRVIRIPGRALMFMDTFFKYLIGESEVMAQAYRIAKAEGLKADAMERRINGLVNTPGSAAWIAAVDKSQELTFTTPLRSNAEGGMLVESVAKTVMNLRNDRAGLGRAGTFLATFYVPFIQTPFNVFRSALRRTPLGMIGITERLARGLYRMKDGMPILDSYPKAAMVRDVSDQTIAWMTAMLLWGITEGDEDDDDKWLLITGSRPWGIDSDGERDMLNRSSGGPSQIRVGTRENGVYLDYGRLDPISTIIGTTTDMIRGVKRVRDGASAKEEAGKMFDYVMNQAEGKTFLQGVTKISEFMKRPGNIVSGAPKSVAQGLVPNLIRQPLRNLDDYQRNTRDAPLWYHALPLGAFAEKRHDLYGNPVQKGEVPLVPDMLQPAARVLFDTGVMPLEFLPPADRALNEWNRENPRETYSPSGNNIDSYKNALGETIELTAAQKAELERQGGREFAMETAFALDPIDTVDPTEETVERIRRIRSAAFKDTRDRLVETGFPVPEKDYSLKTLFGWGLF